MARAKDIETTTETDIMAKDLQIKQKCPHLVIDEWLALEEDGRTLKTVRNPSSSHIRVKRNGMEIPSDGIGSKVSFSSSKAQPFELEKGVTDELRFQTSDGVLQTITLPSGTQVPASRIAEAINAQGSGVIAKAISGKIRLETVQGGMDATIFLQKGSGHEAIGFPPHRFYQGREIMPPWKLIKEQNTFGVRSRKIVFDRPVPSTDDIFEVSYYTQRKECRRCAGIGIENDIRYNSKGDPVFVRGADLLVQEVEKIVFTIRGSNIFYSWYGTSLSELVGQKIAGTGSLVESQLVTEIALTLDRYRDVKIQQSKLQPVTDQEFLMRVQNIEVRQDNVDPTIFRIQVDLQNRADEVDQIQKTLIINDIDGFERVN